MGLFYRASDKEILDTRNTVFLQHGPPALENQGFVKAPFASSWFGRNNLYDFQYEFWRLNGPHLEMIEVYIARGDRWIKIYLNIFEPQPNPSFLEELSATDHLNFFLPPSNLTCMRLRMDDYKVMPLLVGLLGMKEHRLGCYNSQKGLMRSSEKLGKMIGKDMENIEGYIKRWHQMHTPSKVDWRGNIVKNIN